MRVWFVLALVCLLTLPVQIMGGQEGGVLKLPLDLPSGGRGAEDDEEDAPESIDFYGAVYEGDGFFWCLDRSCSMDGPRMLTLKSEVTSAINSISRQSEIGLIAFSQGHTSWSQQPQRATPANKAGAIHWVNLLQPNGPTLIAVPGVATVNLANASSKRRKQIIVVSDGLPGDPAAALQQITGANWQFIPVNTILVDSSVPAAVQFMLSLAEMNQGTARVVE